MIADLSRNWWVLALRGVLGILFGIGAFVWPGLTLAALILVFGAYAFVHGAFADSSGWNEIISTLLTLGYPVVAASNPLRSVTYDATYVASIEIKGGSHVVFISYADTVAAMIVRAATQAG